MPTYQAIRSAFVPDAAGAVKGDQIYFGELRDFAAPPSGTLADIFRPYPVVPYNQSDFECSGGAGKATLLVQGSGRYPLNITIYPNDPASPGASTAWTATADGQTKDVPYAAAGTYSPTFVTQDGQRETFTVTVTAAPPPPAPTPPAVAARKTASTPAPAPEGDAA